MVTCSKSYPICTSLIVWLLAMMASGNKHPEGKVWITMVTCSRTIIEAISTSISLNESPLLALLQTSKFRTIVLLTHRNPLPVTDN